MVLDITYPANEAEWYAKGHFGNGAYFEVPAVFAADGSCDIPATDAKVALFERISKRAAQGTE